MTNRAPHGSRDAPALLYAEQRRGLEIGWRAVLVVLSVAFGLSWFVGAIQADAPAIIRSLFACTVAAIAIDLVLDRLEARFGLGWAIAIGQTQKIVWLGVAWHLMGGVQNPLFLVVFFLPLFTTALLLMRREALLTAGVSVVVGTAVALVEAPELRWYVSQVGFPLATPLSLLRQGGAAYDSPFVGVETGPEFQFVALVAFGSGLVATAFLSRSLVTQVIGFAERLRLVSSSRDEPDELFRAALRQNPVPTALVVPESGQLLEASRSFVNQMLLDRQLAEHTLFESLTFSDPQSVHALLKQESGELPFVCYRVGTETRTASVRGYRIRFGKADFSVVTVQDANELSYLSRLSDRFADPLLILRQGRDVAYFNAAALRLYPNVHFGMDAARLFDTSALQTPDGDAQTAITTTVEERDFVVESLRVPDSGGERLALVRLRPLAPTDPDWPPGTEIRPS